MMFVPIILMTSCGFYGGVTLGNMQRTYNAPVQLRNNPSTKTPGVRYQTQQQRVVPQSYQQTYQQTRLYPAMGVVQPHPPRTNTRTYNERVADFRSIKK